MLQALGAMALALTLLFMLPAAPASAEITCQVASPTLITCTGDAADDDLMISFNSSMLGHNRAAHDSGYASSVDWDRNVPGNQIVHASNSVRIVVDPGAGNDDVFVGDPGTPGSFILAHVEVDHKVVNGINQGKLDRLFVDDSASEIPRTYAFNGNTVSADDVIKASVTSTHQHGGVFLDTSSKDDTVVVDSTSASGRISVRTGDGDDVVRFVNAGANLLGGSIFGGFGTNTADFSARVAPFTVNLSTASIDFQDATPNGTISAINSVLGGAGADTFICRVNVACTITGNGGNDVIEGSDKDDSFLWRIGDGNDTIDGGGGSEDELVVEGDAASNTLTIGPNGSGVAVSLGGPNPATIGANVEGVRLNLRDGDDSVTVTPTTVATVQLSGQGQVSADTLNVLTTPQLQPDLNNFVDGNGQLVFQGRQPVIFGSIENLLVNNQPAAASFQFSTPTLSRDEGAGTAVLTVTRAGNPFANATVKFATTNGSATAGQDYTAASGTLSFASGETSKTVSIPLTSDQADEQDETFTVTLSNPTDAITLGNPSTATVTIRDDDVPPAAQCNPRPKINVVTAKDGPGRLKVTLTAESLPATPNNKLQELKFQAPPNAVVDVAGQTGKAGTFTVPLPDKPTQATFVVRRTAPGAVTVNLGVVDGCGEWKTFVGGGPNAF